MELVPEEASEPLYQQLGEFPRFQIPGASEIADTAHSNPLNQIESPGFQLQKSSLLICDVRFCQHASAFAIISRRVERAATHGPNSPRAEYASSDHISIVFLTTVIMTVIEMPKELATDGHVDWGI
jgi:hypothetical protein